MTILTAALFVGGLGLVLGIILGVSDKYLQVEKNPVVEKLIEMLPGYNCGACGHPGCSGLAEAMNEGTDLPKSCKPCKPVDEKAITLFLKEAGIEFKK